MKHLIKLMSIILTILFISYFTNCKKDNYIIGGSITDTNQFKNMSNYDYLKSNDIFDTVVQVIDAAGFQDSINRNNSTFFLPTDQSVYNYLNSRTLMLQATVNQYAKFTLDSLVYHIKNNIDNIKDSIKMYFFNEALTYDDLDNNGKIFPTWLSHDTAAISYESTRDANNGYNGSITSLPHMVYFTHLWKNYNITDDNPISDISLEDGYRDLVQTSGVYTKNGTINVLSSTHVLFYYGIQK